MIQMNEQSSIIESVSQSVDTRTVRVSQSQGQMDFGISTYVEVEYTRL